jgi:hypothetical protein
MELLTKRAIYNRYFAIKMQENFGNSLFWNQGWRHCNKGNQKKGMNKII